MKTAMKKVLSLSLVLVLLLSIFPVSAFATETGTEIAAPSVEEPAAPAVEEPAAPAVEEPAAPAVEEPAAPAVEEPAAPAVEETTAPAVEETTAPTIEETTAPTVEEPAAPAAEEATVCSVCGKTAKNGMCTGCYLDLGDCVCSKTTAPENNKKKVTLVLDYNHKGARDTKMQVEMDALLRDIVAGIPAPERDKHYFKYWSTDEGGIDRIDENNTSRATREGVIIYAQWAENITSTNKHTYTIRVHLNYDALMGESITNIAKGTEMGDVLDYIEEPTRPGYKFDGWYWDPKGKDDVDDDDKVYGNDNIYAQWTRRKNTNEIMLKIYRHGDTKSVSKIVDMYEYSRDGKISLSEVQEVVKKYYTAKDSKGMSYDGLFDSDSWSDYVRNHRNNRGSKYITVNKDSDTVIYVMVSNSTTITSSSSSSNATADSTNPKTGDMIMTSVAVLGVSASALAVLFFLNKKRAV